MTDEPICPCDVVTHPKRIANPPGLDSIAYRIGDFTTFRRALLQPLRDEVALAHWQPTPEHDLTAQLLDWWAYLADILAFYNERALHEVLLRTAVFPDDVRRIIRLLGYRPRPGIGATGVVAALLDAPRPFVVSRGFPIQGSVDGGQPQVFEVDRDVELGRLGTPLPASARFPTPPGLVSTWTGYANRDASGNLLNAVPARDKVDSKLPAIQAGTPATVAIKGLVTNVGPDDTVLLLRKDWAGELLDQLPGRALAVVHSLEAKWDQAGKPLTVLTLHPGHTLPFGADCDDYRLLKATKLAHLWLYHDRYPGMKTPSVGGTIAQVAEQIFDPGGLFSGGISKEPPQDPHALTSMVLENPTEGAAHLEAIVRGISPGDPVLFEQTIAFPGGFPEMFAQMIGAGAKLAELTQQLEQAVAFLTKVTGYAESIWYANPPEGDRIGQGPPIGPPSHGLISGGAGPIPIPHSKISFHDPLFRASMMSMDDLMIKTIVVHYAWQEVGPLVPVPKTEPTTTPEVPGTDAIPPGTPIAVVVEDATGAGVPGWIGVAGSEPGPPLVGPLRALVNLLPVSRGQTVTGEVLGSGAAYLVNQELALAQSPLTYLTDPQAATGYRSTLRIRVDGIEWHEVPTFYDQAPSARVFVTREDDQQRTFVRFGDGEHGARLPSGTNNIVASYRCGSGAAVPPIGALTTMLKPQKGLQAIRNPIQPGGGADPDPPEQIRRYAPRSVLAFGRAISGDDYETIAAQTPGVARAKVRWGWDPATQRSRVKVFVGDDDAAVDVARDALRAYADPNRPILVELASPIDLDVSFTLEIDPDHDAAAVTAAVSTALLDPDRLPFGLDAVQIDEPLYDSEIYDACLRVAGVIAVHDLAIRVRALRMAPLILAPLGFRIELPMWFSGGVVPELVAGPASPLPPEATTLHVPRPTLQQPLMQPLVPSLRAKIANIDKLRHAAVESTLPRPPIAEPDELWTRSTGERHAPGEGYFYRLRADRLHIAAEVWRHGR